MNNPVKTCFAAALLSLSGSLPASSAALSGTGAVRLDDPAMIQRGEKQFVRNCAVCHGDAGRGGRGKPLAARELDAQRVINTISSGLRRGSSFMPSFEKTLSPEQRRELAAYVLSLRKTP